MECRICRTETKCRNLDLYVTGSEGVWVCHVCEMAIVEFIRTMIRVAGIARRNIYLQDAKKET